MDEQLRFPDPQDDQPTSYLPPVETTRVMPTLGPAGGQVFGPTPVAGQVHGPVPAAQPFPGPAGASRRAAPTRTPWALMVGAFTAGAVLAASGMVAGVRSDVLQLPDRDVRIAQDAGVSSGSTGTGSSASLTRGVVLVETQTTSGQGAGTGMVLTTDGYVLTNYHVVASSTRVRVSIADTGQSTSATVVGHDATADVALLKLDGASDLATVTIDDDHDLAVGSSVTAVGNAHGQGFLSRTTGQVMALSDQVTVADRNSSTGSETLSGVFRTTAEAVPGDSGGPMLDDEGEVVGMTTAGEQVGGRRTAAVTVASYAVPIEKALQVVEQIRSGKESGTVQIGPRAYLGISVAADVTDELRVAEVVEGGAAEAAGLAVGDAITSLDGKQVNSHAELAAVLEALEPGDTVPISWIDAQGASREGQVALGSSPVN